MKVLVDTSVWIAHFRHRSDRLARLLENGSVVCHPHVVVEIACGTPPDRRFVIPMLSALESVPVATHDELLRLIERRSLHGRGCGLVDVHLIAATLFGATTVLWTLDKRLDAIAVELGRSYRSVLH